ncbi:hypothetical protein E2C01_067924 [Portunus trituberculatus]|uniref:Uncharacterized protein n=1 Tax=Portunus trituberculatus TaxID=210409 RepID=A0A5B7HMD6_PORTR|nr:hypothetical protein [Portunus trituberculatus]
MMSLATCTRKESCGFRPEEVAHIERRLLDFMAKSKELERRHQVLLEILAVEKDKLTDVTFTVEALQRSVRDMSALAQRLEVEHDVALREAAQEEQKQERLFLKRRWRAKLQLRRSERQAKAAERVALLQTQAKIVSVQVALNEVQRLHDLRQEINLSTERILASREAGWSEGVLGWWWRRLSSFFRDNPMAEDGFGSQVSYPNQVKGKQNRRVPVMEPMSDIGSEFKTHRRKEGSVSPEMEVADRSSRSFGLDHLLGEAEDAAGEQDVPLHTAQNNTTNVGGGASPRGWKRNRLKGLLKWVVLLHTVTILVSSIVRLRHESRCPCHLREHQGNFRGDEGRRVPASYRTVSFIISLRKLEGFSSVLFGRSASASSSANDKVQSVRR